MLTRSIGLLHATAMVVGTIIGASIFVRPSEVSREVPSFAGMLLVRLGKLPLTDEERSRVCGGNAARLLGFEL